MSKRPLDFEAIQLARANLARIARENPQMIDRSRARWSEEEIAGMIVDPTKMTYSTQEAAEILGCHEETVRREIQKGNLPAAKLGRMFVISKSDLESFYQAKGGKTLFPPTDDEAGA